MLHLGTHSGLPAGQAAMTPRVLGHVGQPGLFLPSWGMVDPGILAMPMQQASKSPTMNTLLPLQAHRASGGPSRTTSRPATPE